MGSDLAEGAACRDLLGAADPVLLSLLLLLSLVVVVVVVLVFVVAAVVVVLLVVIGPESECSADGGRDSVDWLSSDMAEKQLPR